MLDSLETLYKYLNITVSLQFIILLRNLDNF
jgi:hypothetical protein